MKTLRRILFVTVLTLGAGACSTDAILGPHSPDPGNYVPDSGNHAPDPGNHSPDPGN